MAFACVKENPFSSSGLTGINMGHNADISHILQHSANCSQKIIKRQRHTEKKSVFVP
jgi:hypothetical protein